LKALAVALTHVVFKKHAEARWAAAGLAYPALKALVYLTLRESRLKPAGNTYSDDGPSKTRLLILKKQACNYWIDQRILALDFQRLAHSCAWTLDLDAKGFFNHLVEK
jgi:hypothetical protein